MPHVGKLKVKSILALLAAFLLWQPFRLLFPELEIHPVFIYIYALLEIRDNSAKTINMGKVRIKATFIALALGLPALALRDELFGFAAVVFIILLVSDSNRYVDATLRALQTILGVFIAWVINVRLFPYPGKPAVPPDPKQN